MKIEHSGQDIVHAPAQAVWAFVRDPARVGACLPDVERVVVHDDRRFDATVAVRVGPFRGQFRMKATITPDEPAGRVSIVILGGGFGSALDLTASADIRDLDAMTTLDWKGEVDVRGTVAAVGGPLLDPMARKLIAQTFANMSRELDARPTR